MTAYVAGLRRAASRLRGGIAQVTRAVTSRLGIVVPVRAEGAWWVRIPDDQVLHGVRAGTYERREIDLVRMILRQGDTFLDIGAHFGLYSVVAAKQVGRGGRVIAFEPNPRNRLCLRLNALLNGQGQIETMPYALSNEVGETGFVAVSQGAYSAFRVAEAPGERSQIRVRQTTLDTVMEERNVGSVDLLKVDVEGAELLVLQGGERCLTQAPRPLLLCEFNDVRAAPYGHTGSQVYAWLHDRGYAWFSLPGGATLKAETEGRAYRYTNLLACPPEKRDRIAAMMSA